MLDNSRRHQLKFVFASLLGMALFLFPMPIAGEASVLLAHANRYVKEHLMDEVLGYGAIASMLTLLCSILVNLLPGFGARLPQKFASVFEARPLALFVRLAGAAIYLMVYFGWGPELLIGEETGAMVVTTFIAGLYVTFTLGNIILPLLLEFGLLEFIGRILQPVMRKCFNVPGRSAVDAVASFVGDGTLGIIVTDEQYAQGHYTKREATLIAMSFSVVGIAFASFVAEELGFADRFLLFYGTIIVSSILVAWLLARSPLIKRYPDAYHSGKERHSQAAPTGFGLAEAYESALKRSSKGGLHSFKKMLPVIFDIHMTFMPVIVFVGTLGLIIASETPLFTWLSYPLVPLFELLRIPDAELVASASIVGFVDMYLPTIFIRESSSELARFVVGTLSFTQLIFMAETGAILLKTRMGFKFHEVLGFFLVRTLLSLPVIVIIGHVFL